MNKIKNVLQKVKVIDLFLVVSLGLTTLFLIINFVTSGAFFSSVILEPQCQFYDYFYIMAGATNPQQLYHWQYNYFPPLAYCMYYFLWKINAVQVSNPDSDWHVLFNYDNNLLIFVVFFILQILLLCYCLSQCFRSNKTTYTFLLPIALVLSYPITCSTLQRGNSVLLAALFVALAWIWIDSESKAKRELALILIALAASFKFVPAIMGLEYVRRKDWKRVMRLILYGILFVFVPFAFYGGMDGLLALISNLTSFTEGSRYGLYTVKGAVEWFALKLFGLSGDTVSMFGTITQYIFLIVCIVFAFISKKSWQRAMFYAGIMASFLSTGWMYTCVYYLPVVILFLKEYQNGWNADNKVWVIINTCLWAIVFSIPLPILWGNKMTEYDGIYFVLYVILLINMIHVLFEPKRQHKRNCV